MKNFRERTFFLGVVIGRVFRVLFCLCFCFICWFFVPENVSRKLSYGQVRCLENFRERTFVLWSQCWSCVFWCCFAYVFASLFVFFAPETVLKNSLDVRFGVFGLSSFFLWFFRRRRRLFFLRETAQVVTGHTPRRTLCFFPCSFCCPAALVCSPFLAVRPASWCFLGVPFWAPRVFGILLVLF